jgi:hypothetical protein
VIPFGTGCGSCDFCHRLRSHRARCARYRANRWFPAEDAAPRALINARNVSIGCLRASKVTKRPQERTGRTRNCGRITVLASTARIASVIVRSQPQKPGRCVAVPVPYRELRGNGTVVRQAGTPSMDVESAEADAIRCPAQAGAGDCDLHREVSPGPL